MLTDFFSLELLIKTLFAPWKNDVWVVQNAALADRVKIWQGNIASRAVGLIVRLLVIVVALIVIGLTAIVEGLLLLSYLLLPALVVVLPIIAGVMFS